MEFNIEGLAELRERLNAMRERTTHLEPALLRAGLVALKAAADRIDAGGPGWAPNVTGTPLLHQTGRLLSSLTVGAPGNIAQLDGDSIIVGTNVRYAAWLQGGTGIYGPSGKKIVPKEKKALAFALGVFHSVKGTPPRKYLFIDGQVAERVSNVFAAYIMGRAQGDAA